MHKKMLSLYDVTKIQLKKDKFLEVQGCSEFKAGHLYIQIYRKRQIQRHNNSSF